MYRQCTQPKAVATQIRYEQCLLELMKEKNYHEITINDICQEMGTSRKSFYHFFKNKEGCICALIDRMFYESQSYQPPDFDPRGYPPTLVRSMLYMHDHREILTIVFSNGLAGLMLQRQIFLVQEDLQRRQHKDEHTRDAAIFYTCGFMAILHDWHLSGYQRTVYEIVDSIIHLVAPEHLNFW